MPRGHRLQVPVDTQVQCILEGLSGTPVEELCRRYTLSQSQYYRLRDRFLEGGKAGLVSNGRDAERAAFETRIGELERVVGRLTVENQALKKRCTERRVLSESSCRDGVSGDRPERP